MNDNDESNDNDVLCAVRDSLSGVPMPTAPRLEAIVARGRASRRRRQAALSAAGVASAVALLLGLSGVTGSGSPAPARSNSQAHLTAISVVSNPNGTTTLTFYGPGALRDPSTVRQALAQHGIPALVTVGKFCTTAVRPNAPGAFSYQPGGAKKVTIVFTPSAMPAGSEFSIGYRHEPQVRDTTVTLIESGAPLTCSTMPFTNPAGGPS